MSINKQFDHDLVPSATQSMTVLITAGGTGGHVIPAYVLHQTLQQSGHQTHFVTDARGQRYIDTNTNDNISVIPLPRYQGGLDAKLKFLWALLPSIYQCWRLIKYYRITTVVGFGGYIAVPALIAAVITRCRIILHEQNTVLGRVNRLFGLVAHKIAISTPNLTKFPQHLRHKCVTTGLPVRPEIAELRQQLLPIHFKGKAQQALHVLIIGGSQAAAYFSQIMPCALELMPESLRRQIHLHQQCRHEDLAQLEEAYMKLGVGVQLTTFFDDMPNEYLWADLIITRAGASSIAEISTIGKAALLIPYPHAMDDHQTTNAKMAIEHGGGWWQSQSACHSTFVQKFLMNIFDHPQVLLSMAEKMRTYGFACAVSNMMRIMQND